MRIGYARVSTIDQNLDLQLDALDSAGCVYIYQDDGVSGKKAKRHGLDLALHKLEQGDTLVVWKLDRLGRSLQHLIEIMKELERRGIEFVSLSDAIDTSTPHGKLFFHIVGAFGEYESNLISERTKAGMAAARARGVKLGRPKKLTPEQKEAIVDFTSEALDAAALEVGANCRPDGKSNRTLQ